MTLLGKTALALALRMSRPTVDGYLNRKEPIPPQPDKKRRYALEEVAAYIAQVRQLEGETKSVSHWRSEKLRLEVETRKKEAAQRAGEWVSITEARRVVEAVMAELAGLMKQKFEYELPSRYVGKDAVECQALNADAIDTITLRFKQGVRQLVAGAA